MISTIISVIGSLISTLAPPVAAAITGGQSVEEAIAAARKAAEALPEREAAGGDSTAGAWDRDLAERKARGEAP